MSDSGVWISLDDLDARSVSRRENRCTWHGSSARRCGVDPVIGVVDRRGLRWSACPAAARAVAADRGVPLPEWIFPD